MKVNLDDGTVIVSIQNIDKVTKLIKDCMLQIRSFSDKPLEGYEPEDGILSEVEKVQESIFDIASELGIDLGADWGIKVNLEGHTL